MSFEYLNNDNRVSTKWRSLILFGSNTATYKFAFAKSLLELVETGKNRIKLSDLSVPFANHLSEHLKKVPKQINSGNSKLLDSILDFNLGSLSYSQMIAVTEKEGFKYVIDAFQHLHGDQLAVPFYFKDYQAGNKAIVVTDELLR